MRTTIMKQLLNVIGAVTTAVALLVATVPSHAADADFVVTTLGTGAPPPLMDRFSAAILVRAGKQKLLFDAGRGVAQRLWQTKTPFGSIDAVFLTHLHSDHVVGLPDFWLTGWLDSAFGGRKSPMKLYGPVGTANLAAGLRQAFSWDIEHRMADQKMTEDGVRIAVKEIVEGIIYEADGVKVSAIEVDHGELLKPAFGYRIDYDGRSMVISGDTRYSENLIAQAKGTSLLLHSVAMVNEELLTRSQWYRDILAHHTPPQDVGRVFAATQPKLAALTHFVLLGDQRAPAPSLDDVTAEVRKTYSGPLMLSKDLMKFTIGRDSVTVE